MPRRQPHGMTVARLTHEKRAAPALSRLDTNRAKAQLFQIGAARTRTGGIGHTCQQSVKQKPPGGLIVFQGANKDFSLKQGLETSP